MVDDKEFVKAELERLKSFILKVNTDLKEQKQINTRSYIKTDNRLKNLEKKCG